MEKNIYKKLAEARLEFLKQNVKPSGKHIQLEFTYFELKDIIPAALEIFNKVGLLAVVSFSKEIASMTIIDVDKPDSRIEFTSPMRDVNVIVSSSGKQVTNEIQTLGSMETYQRRYLYLIALDIVEHDSIDMNTGNQSEKVKPTKSIPIDTIETEQNDNTKQKVANEEDESKTTKVAIRKKPLSTTERKDIKKDVTAISEPADPLQIKALRKVLRILRSEHEELVQEIVVKTDRFNNLTKASAEKLITELGQLVQELSPTEDGEE